VDVRDVAAGLILFLGFGQIGQRYILGGEKTSLPHLLYVITQMNGRANLRVCVSMPLASGISAIMEWFADSGGHPPTPANREGVEIARRSRPLSSEKRHAGNSAILREI